MKKNIVIAALVLWNLVLTAALVLVWARTRSSSDDRAKVTAAVGAATGDAQEFTFRAGERLNSDVAPQIRGRSLAITAVIDTQQQDGVVIAQGGLAHGYALYVQGGELFFAARRDQTLTTVSGGKIAEGRHTVTATWTKEGDLSLAMDGRSPATGKAAGAITVTPTDGLDVGSDRYAAVGPYTAPNKFGGTIYTVSLRTTP